MRTGTAATAAALAAGLRLCLGPPLLAGEFARVQQDQTLDAVPGRQSGGGRQGKGSRPASPLSPPTTASWPRPESRPGESVRRKTTFQIGAAQCGQIRVQCSQSVMPSATTRFFCKVQNVHLFHLFVKPRFGIPQKPPKPTNGYLAKNLHCFVIQ